MSVPFNSQDYDRFLKLAEAINQNRDRAEISVYIGRDQTNSAYTSLEIKGYLTVLELTSIFEQSVLNTSDVVEVKK